MKTTQHTEPTPEELAELALQPGVKAGMSDAEYFALPACSSTELRALDRSPAYAAQVREHGIEPTDAMEFGSMVHALVLDQPFKWVPIDGDGRTKAVKEAKSAARAKGQEPIKGDLFQRAHDCADSVRTHPAVAKLLDEADAVEEVVVWKRNGLPCKSKKDARSGSVLWDLKTCASVDRFSPWAINDKSYHVQAAWYLEGEMHAGAGSLDFKWVAVSSSAPFEVAVYGISDNALREGYARVGELFAMYSECVKRNQWPRHFLTERVGDIPRRWST